MSTRPVLKYNGSKWIIAPWIIQHFPEHKAYVDLFGGGASVILRKPRSRFEYYNDLDRELYIFFRVLRDQPRELIRAIRFTPYSRDEFNEVKSEAETDLEIARRFYARCWMNMSNNRLGGTFRSHGNIRSSGGYRPAYLFSDLKPLIYTAHRFRGVVIDNKDYRQLAKEVSTPDTLIYADPPYLQDTRKAGRAYTHELMSEDDHLELFEVLNSLDAKVIVSGYPSDLYSRTFEQAGWTRLEKKSLDNKRNTRSEAIWLNPACQSHTKNTLSLFAETI